MSQNVFVYGTLMYPDVLKVLLNRVPTNSTAAIHGFRRYSIKGQVFPGVIQSTPESQVQGVLLKGLTPEDMVVFDEFEGDEYRKVAVTPQLPDGSTEEASVYIWQDSLRSYLYGEWDPEAFAATHLESYAEMCQRFIDELREQQGKPQSRPLGFGGTSSSNSE